MNFLKRNFLEISKLILLYAGAVFALKALIGSDGLWGHVWDDYSFLKVIIYVAAMTHITITCMSLSFHRFHTHKGVVLNKFVDVPMQVWLWLITSMNKLDWVSIHMYHHMHSDQEKDPHSPKHKGLAHVFFLGAYDYTQAKDQPDVLKIRSRLSTTPFEVFMSKHQLMGPIITMALLMVSFGVKWGTILGVINFLISPVFAVGGVNAIAHWWGYKNHQTKDNSRNIGFLFPLNFLICGELDHNNHHAHQKSCSFRHKWYEFDIGYIYIKALKSFKLAEIKTVYNTKKFKQEFAIKAHKLLEYDYHFKERFEKLAAELNHNAQDLKEQLGLYIQGKKAQLSEPAKEFAREVKAYLKAQAALSPA